MNNCVSKNSADFKSLYKEVFGIDNIDAGLEQILAAKISVWQDENGLDKWPLASDMQAAMASPATMAYITDKTSGKGLIKPGVAELFESNPELANAVYEALGLNNINESEITYTDEEGNPCAKMGLTNATKGTDWKIVKDFKGQPKHSNGGVDITISDKGVSMRRGGKDIKAAHGLLIPATIKATLNPKNWGVTDYTDKGSRGAAYAAARKAGEKEFMWNGKRFNTKYDGTPQQQLKETGITDAQLHKKNILQRNLGNNLTPFNYDPTGLYAIGAALGIKSEGRKDVEKIGEEDGITRPILDAINMYSGKPQKHNTFNLSKYEPSNAKDTDGLYYKINDFEDTVLKQIEKVKNVKDAVNTSGLSKEDIIKVQKQIEGYYNPIFFHNDNYNRLSKKQKRSLKKIIDKDGKMTDPDVSVMLTNLSRYNTNTGGVWGGDPTVMRSYNLGLGSDNKGDYISYYDKWDIEPIDFGKPFEIYDRIYIKDYGDGKQKRMYYSDKELSELDINKKNFDTLALQRELSNRGYKLPKSTKQDGSFDGIWGDETKNALLDYQSQNNK